VLVDQLRIHGVDNAFCVAGGSDLATLDALYGARNAIRMITCHQEGGVTNMAEVYGKITGKPGIAFVTRGPGACNGSIGVHTAMQDSTPMVIFIGVYVLIYVALIAAVAALVGISGLKIAQTESVRQELAKRCFQPDISLWPSHDHFHIVIRKFHEQLSAMAAG